MDGRRKNVREGYFVAAAADEDAADESAALVAVSVESPPWRSPPPPPPPPVRTADVSVACFWMGRKSLNSGGSSSSLYNLSLK